MLLENKNAVIYGAGGAIGGAVARAFAREGARVFLAGRTLAKLHAVAKEISAAGGVAETAQVDALDEQAVEAHADVVAQKAGRIDVSFKAIGIPQRTVQGTPLVELSAENFNLPIQTHITAHFLIARVVARHMLRKGSGVILTITALPARMAAPLVGGIGPAWAAMEALSRNLAAELGPQGVRVICLRSAGMPETPIVQEVLGLHAKATGMTPDQVQALWAAPTLLRRLGTLDETANVAAFMASDRASGMTGTFINVTCGSRAD